MTYYAWQDKVVYEGGIYTSVAEWRGAMKAINIDLLRRPIDTGGLHNAAQPGVLSISPAKRRVGRNR